MLALFARLSAMVCLIAPLAACQSAARMEQPLAIEADDYTRTYEAALHSLRDHGFAIDRQDHRFGVITSEPLAAPTLLEPWKPSHTTLGQTVESTVNDQQRIARIRLVPRAEAHEQYDLSVEVIVQRRQLPARRLSGSTTPRRMFNNQRQVPQPLREQNVPRSYWREVGRDRELEQRLTHDIHKKLEA